MNQALQIHSDDNVAVCLAAQPDIPIGHKVALRHIPAGNPIIKYGQPMGLATCDIAPGQWVHTHNVRSQLSGLQAYAYQPILIPPIVPLPAATFEGYLRDDGQAGSRNEIWIIPTVGCINAIAKRMEQLVRHDAYPNLDGIFAYSHPYGCSQLGQDHYNTQQALCGLIRHPNAGAVLVVGLGCENNHIDALKAALGQYDPERVSFLNCQDHDDELAAALPKLKQLCRYTSRFTRQPCSTQHLIAGLKCGGSDGFSGITANPLLGRFTDRLIAQGGSAILTEVPEMFGAETLLMNRCVTSDVFDKAVSLINDYKRYFISHGQPLDENPSPGNREGGITTLEEKSLGCVQKGGLTPVVDVLSYGQPLEKQGLNLLQAPGNDLVASAALAISGAQIVLFTTGRGTPFGCPVPTLKIASNSPLAYKKAHWIDFDAGALLDGASAEMLQEAFFQLVLSVASGRHKVKSEGLDKRDLAIWKDGVTL